MSSENVGEIKSAGENIFGNKSSLGKEKEGKSDGRVPLTLYSLRAIAHAEKGSK